MLDNDKIRLAHYETKQSFEQDSDVRDTDVALIDETNEVITHGKSYKRYEWNTIGVPSIKPEKAQCCDVVLVNKTTLKKVITRDIDNIAENFPPENWEPIGVVVIPGEHGVLKDGTGTKNQCGVMSLVPMSCETPEIGATSEIGICWGYGSLDIIDKSDELGRYDSITNGLLNYNKRAYDTSASNKSTQLSSDNNVSAYIPMQGSIGGKPSWGSYASSAGYVPSPYANDDLKSGDYNSFYGTTEFDTASGFNALADFRGIVNTKIITDLATAEDWRNLESITNSKEEGYYPAACCCARFKTIGTKAFKDYEIEELKNGTGFWYLPACGESGYILPRIFDINDTISKLKSTYGVGVKLGGDGKYWTSSEHSSLSGLYMSTSTGYISQQSKGNKNFVRAFMRL